MASQHIDDDVSPRPAIAPDAPEGRASEATVTTADQPSSHATLGTLVRDLGPGIVAAAVVPRGLDVAVSEAVVHDPVFPPAIERGDLVIGVGLLTDDPAAHEVVDAAGRAGASAVTFKLRGDVPATLVETARAGGIAVLTVPPEMAWGQFVALVRTAIASSGQAPDGLGGVAVGDLFSLANAVASMAGGAVTIEDPQSRVMAYSTIDEPIDEPRRQTILGRQVPATWLRRLRDAGVFRKLWTTNEVVVFEHPDEQLRPRLAIAVRAGEEILGSVWIAQGRRPFDDRTEHVLREAARMAALHLIRHRATEDVERRMRGELLRSVLEGRGPVEVLASRLGVEAQEPFTVVAFELAAKDEGVVLLQRERTLDLIAVYSEAFRRRAACTAFGGVIYALLPSSAPLRRERLAPLAHDVVQRASEALGVSLRAGIGSTVEGLRETPRSRWEADQALRVLNTKPAEEAVADIDDVRGLALLLELQDLAAERPHLRAGKLERLVAHDAAHSSSYVDTLRAYFDAFGDVPRAAERVNVHPNTFRYRLRRVVEISGIDLDDPRERLSAEIQLQFL